MEEEGVKIINIEEFQKIELRVGAILSAERILGSDKLLKLAVDFAEAAPRQIISGIGKVYEPETIVGKKVVFVVNLEPRELVGLTSQGMILAAKDENGLALIVPDKDVAPGSRVG